MGAAGQLLVDPGFGKGRGLVRWCRPGTVYFRAATSLSTRRESHRLFLCDNQLAQSPVGAKAYLGSVDLELAVLGLVRIGPHGFRLVADALLIKYTFIGVTSIALGVLAFGVYGPMVRWW